MGSTADQPFNASGKARGLTPHDVDQVREHWRALRAREGRSSLHFVVLHELLPGEAVALLQWRHFTEPAGEEILSDEEIARLAAMAETPIPRYYAWRLRLRDGEVRLLEGGHPEPPPPHDVPPPPFES